MADIDKIIETLQIALDNAEIDGTIYAEVRRHIVFDIISLLKEQRKIVRCKDCKMYNENDVWDSTGYGRCIHLQRLVPPDWFCADGERK